MSYALTKLITQLIYPFNLGMLGLAIGALLLAWRWRRERRLAAPGSRAGVAESGAASGCRPAGNGLPQGPCVVSSVSRVRRLLVSGPLWLGLSLVWLWIWSTPALCIFLIGSLERRYPPVAVEALPSADMIVVLGGCMAAAVPPRLYPELGDASSRLWHGARLYRAGKAPLIVVTSPTNETAAMKEFLVDLGVPATAIIREMRSRTTYENADFTRELFMEATARGPVGKPAERGSEAMGQPTAFRPTRAALPRILLVTSAQHMSRAEMIFKRVGFEVIPVGTCYAVTEESAKHSLMHWLPDAGALGGSSAAFKEYVGNWVYRFRKVEGERPPSAGTR